MGASWFDDSALREGKGYWVYMNESGNLTLPSVGGSLSGESYEWSKLRFWNGSEERGIVEAGAENWVDNQLRYWDNGFKFLCPEASPYDCHEETLFPYNGIFIWSNRDNITLIRQN